MQEEISDDKIRETVRKLREHLPPRLPVSTYRLQFNRSFTFSDAKALIPYLDSLGITDIYASPYFKALRGSTHGYDITAHDSLNPELGSEEDYEGFTAELHRHGMGQILDIVPNHMSIAGGQNAWWADVLENGPGSPYAPFFDIDWKPVKEELENKVIIPMLGDQYGRVLENQELVLSFEEGAFYINYYSHRLPVEPTTYTRLLEHRIEVLEGELESESPHFQELLSIITALGHLPSPAELDAEKRTERLREKEIIKKRLLILYSECPEFKTFVDENVRVFNGTKDDPRSFDLLDALLGAQVYRLSYWQVATEEINYRRFFDINDMAAIRMEEPRVFSEAHRLIFRLIREGKVTGLRVDHPDGLHNPTEYFKRLQEDCFIHLCMGRVAAPHNSGDPDEKLEERIRKICKEEPNPEMPFYIIGEKILADGERIPEDWPIFGTTGYVFMNSVGGIFVDSANARVFDGIYSRFIREKISFPEIVYEKKKLIMETSMSSEINVLGHSLNRISEKDRRFRDFTLNNLTDAIVEVIAFFPVYRTYIDSGVNDSDRLYTETAVLRATRHCRDLSASIFDFLRDILMLRYPEKPDQEIRKQCLEFTMKFQQLTGPVMAKGLEDTVFYSYNRLLSLNEVGGNPSRFGTAVDALHYQNMELSKQHPCSLTATSTHDSKRGEDVRTRLNVLSELPGEWKDCLAKWSRLNRKHKSILDGQPAPDRNGEYLLYQTLLGAWPMDESDPLTFRQRIQQYMLKAVREAKENTNWINPDAGYEEALMKFIEKVMTSPQFLNDFRPFQKKLSHYGMLNSLSQTLLKIASPGVPDFYQGTELWDLNLVDPDNRRPVDYASRIRMLEELQRLEPDTGPLDLCRQLLGDMKDGRIKLYLTSKALAFRKTNKELFPRSEYIPLQATGKLSEHVFAFARGRDKKVVIAGPRLVAGFVKPFELPLGDVWDGTYLTGQRAGATYKNIFTGQTVETVEHEGQASLRLQDILSDFPVALMEEM